MPGARRRGRPRLAWIDNIKTWTGLPVEESVRMTENRDEWRMYVHGVLGSRTAKEQNRTEFSSQLFKRQLQDPLNTPDVTGDDGSGLRRRVAC